MALLSSILVLLVALSGCSARRSEPIAGPFVADNRALKSGQQVFMKHCHQCHPGGEAGLGPALNDKPMPVFWMTQQIRRGFGAMPAFSEQDISSKDLDDLLAYLKALRNHG